MKGGQKTKQMKYKILGIALLVIMLSLVAMPLMTAEDNVSTETTDSVISTQTTAVETVSDDLDESENVGAVRMSWEKFSTWLTFNQEKKAEKELKLARLELIRAKIAAKNNNSVAMERALDAHQKLIERINERMNKLEARNLSSDKLVGLDRAIEVHEARIAKMNEILANANLTADQIARIEAKIAKAENVTSNLGAIQERAQEQVREKLADGEEGSQEQEQNQEQKQTGKA